MAVLITHPLGGVRIQPSYLALNTVAINTMHSTLAKHHFYPHTQQVPVNLVVFVVEVLVKAGSDVV